MQSFSTKKHKAIFIDLDGTLLRHDLTISELDQQAVIQANEQGMEVIFASGRPYDAIAQTATKLGVGKYVIASNGGSVVNLHNRQVLNTSPIPKDIALLAAEAAYQNGATPTMYTATDWFAERLDQHIALEQERANLTPQISTFDSIIEPIIKILNIGDKLPLEQLDKSLKMSFSSQLEWFYTYPEYLEVMEKGASKGNARDGLLTHLGITVEETIAIGDGLNDCTLVEGAGIGVAMSNGNNKLKEIADVITLRNEENGVAAAIYGLLFEQAEFVGKLHFKNT